MMPKNHFVISPMTIAAPTAEPQRSHHGFLNTYAISFGPIVCHFVGIVIARRNVRAELGIFGHRPNDRQRLTFAARKIEVDHFERTLLAFLIDRARLPTTPSANDSKKLLELRSAAGGWPRCSALEKALRLTGR
jgi:hypothetical protein